MPDRRRESVVLSIPSLTWTSVGVLAALLGVYLLYLLGMAGFLAICGVPRRDIAKWALRQADRQRLVELIGAATGRGSPSNGRSSH
ncbi:MAG TPA: hypothetical protein VN748_22205 [Pseudonocardiaceae bacterium]|jgi:hypothetical protein|nr:hypothetical protein [Pseudonocardiaceae bacterium]